MSIPLTDQLVIDYSGEHLIHELSMFWQLAGMLPGKRAGFMTSVMLESWVIHLRNLIDFFCEPGHGDDVTARHFFDIPAAWAPTMPAELDKAKTRANKELSHLTRLRKSGSFSDEWQINITVTAKQATCSKRLHL